MSEKQYRRIKIRAGKRGWGGPLVIEPKPGKDLVYCVTGGGIHPVAQRIADLCGGTPFDGFRSKADFEKIAVAVIDCGGTARVGVYPMKGVPTVDVYATKPSGPLFRFIKETNFVSGVGMDEIELFEGETPAPVVDEVVVEKVEMVVEKVAAPVEEVPGEKTPKKKKRKGFLKALLGE